MIYSIQKLNKNQLFAGSVLLIGIVLLPLQGFKNRSVNWEEVQLDSIISVRFPGKPAFYTIQNTPMYIMRTPEALYMAMALMDTDMPLEKSPARNEGSLKDFYSGLMSAMAEDKKGIVVDTASFYLNNYRGMNFSINSPLPNGSSITRYNHAILIGNKTYSLMITPLLPFNEEIRGINKHFFESMRMGE